MGAITSYLIVQVTNFHPAPKIYPCILIPPGMLPVLLYEAGKGKFQGTHAKPELAYYLCTALNGWPIIPVAGRRSIFLDAHTSPSSIKNS